MKFPGERIGLYGIQGVCKIVEITKKFWPTPVEYYVLRPGLRWQDTRVFVPTQNEAASRMRRVLSPEEAHKIVSRIPRERAIWVEEEKRT